MGKAAAMIALIVEQGAEGEERRWVETLSDDREIDIFEAAQIEGTSDPLSTVYDSRRRQTQEEDEFGDYIEELLSNPFLRPEIQEHAIQWLKSKIRIDQFHKTEQEAAQVIARCAFGVFEDDPSRTDFFLSGPTTSVRIRVFVLTRKGQLPKAPPQAA